MCTLNRPFAASHLRGTKPACWRAKVAPGQDKQKAYIILNGNFLCLPSSSATFALQREWLAAKPEVDYFGAKLNGQKRCHFLKWGEEGNAWTI